MGETSVVTETNGQTRLAYVLGVPLALHVVRQWPQMEEIVRGRELVGAVEGTSRPSRSRLAAGSILRTLSSSNGPSTTVTTASTAM